jgi:hypothetical protein
LKAGSSKKEAWKLENLGYYAGMPGSKAPEVSADGSGTQFMVSVKGGFDEKRKNFRSNRYL